VWSSPKTWASVGETYRSSVWATYSPAGKYYSITGYLKAVWLEMFGPVFPGYPAETDPRDPPRPPGPAPHINFHKKPAPQTNSKAKWRRTKNSARLPSGTQTSQGEGYRAALLEPEEMRNRRDTIIFPLPGSRREHPGEALESWGEGGVVGGGRGGGNR